MFCVITEPLAPSGVSLTSSTESGTATLSASWTQPSDKDASVTYRIQLTKGTQVISTDTDNDGSRQYSDRKPGSGPYKVCVWAVAGDGNTTSNETCSTGDLYTSKCE